MPTPKANPTKRKVRYCQKVADLIVEVIGNGGTDSDVAAAVGIERSTLYRWIKSHPELQARVDAIRNGLDETHAEAVLDQLAECRVLAESYTLKLFKGEIQRVKTRTDGTGAVIFKDSEVVLPSDRLVERFLQLQSAEQHFKLSIDLAEPFDDA
ncbi:hypothetical protein IQ273_30910 [Nodosilinea sp. LEGE 07298]|uniref:hypothetical protein n=1 Tax=Nodosilinea sp. LEGE 07298 TaxID=2777970 RepID=UPI00187EFB68|nr:hypothetical protein [Nodosilinea sp. LEGE 07298]MBE9113784.1 hypothetical protein [Nodosilinea sp. LEGE 07298]